MTGKGRFFLAFALMLFSVNSIFASPTMAAKPSKPPKPTDPEYCSSKGKSYRNEWIAGVELGSHTNTTAANRGYGDFTATTIDLGFLANSLVLTPGFKSAAYEEFWKVFVDFDQDLTFDADEVVFSANSTGAVSGSFDVPISALPGNTRMRVSMSRGVEPPACGNISYGEVEDYTVNIPTDTTPPVVSSVIPLDGATDVAIDSIITATFSEAMSGATITNTSFVLNDGVADIVGTVAYAGLDATFTPAAPLAYETIYSATITTAALDLAGNPLPADHLWTFTTAPEPDTIPPVVNSTVPADAATDVDINAVITATFSETMDGTTITNATIVLNDGVADIVGTVAYAGLEATFTPDVPLAYETIYTATITTGALDLAGNPLPADHLWTFTTAPEPDTIPPVVNSTVPADAATDVDINAVITATFSETMDGTTITNAAIVLNDGVADIVGTVAYAGLEATFTPDVPLAYETIYTATITADVADVAGNLLGTDYVWSFTTAALGTEFIPICEPSYMQCSGFGVSADGNVVVGRVYDFGSSYPRGFRWTAAEGIVTLSRTAMMHGANTAGDVVVGIDGRVLDYSDQRAVKWTEGVGTRSLEYSYPSEGIAVSGDGAIVVGSRNLRAYKWIDPIGSSSIPGLETSSSSQANDISADGTMIVGYGALPGTAWDEKHQAFLWTESGGTVGLGDLPGGGFHSEATAISPDGSIIVGVSETDYHDGFRWTQEEGMVSIGTFDPVDVANNGTIVGNAYGGGAAYIYFPDTGSQRLRFFLEDEGIDLTGWYLIATGISADGKVIVGYGNNPDSKYEAWMVRLND